MILNLTSKSITLLLLDIPSNIELQVAADAGLLGSIDANHGDEQNGWDTDQFPYNINELTESMLIILESRRTARRRVNFDAKIRRNSTDAEDLFFAHIGGMDLFAKSSNYCRQNSG